MFFHVRFRVSLKVLDPLNLHARKPADAILGELLPLRLQLGLVQTKIVHRANAQNGHRWEGRTDAVHESAARVAKVVGHGGVFPDGGDGVLPALEVFLTAQVLQVFVVDAKVGCEHGCGEFAAVHAVAYKGVDQTRRFGRLAIVLEWRAHLNLV
jgi:hypothetical protein